MKKMIILSNKKIYNFFKEHIGEPLSNPFISYLDIKTKYPIGIKDLRHQLDQITPEKFNFFKNTELILIKLDCF